MSEPDSIANAEPARRRRRDPRALGALWPFVRPYWGVLVAALIALTASSFATLVLPKAGGGLIDHGFTKSNLGAVSDYFLLALAACVFLGIASGARFYLVSWLGERVVADLRNAVYNHLLRLSASFFETARTGEVLSRLTTDTTLIQTIVGSSASMGLRNLFVVIGGSIMMAKTSPALAGLAALGVPAVVVPIVFYGRSVRNLSRINQDKIADTSAVAGEVLSAVQTVQAATQEEAERSRFARAVELAFASANKRNVARAFLTAAVISLISGAIVGVLWVGAKLVLSSQLSPGQLGEFILDAVLVAGGFGVLSEVWGDIQKAAGATERLMELLRVDPVIKAPATPKPLPSTSQGAVALDHVSFRYPMRPDHLALDDFSLTVKPGEVVALVGPSGAGKSTVFQLILRFYDPDQGRVLFDGDSLTELDPVQLRSRMAIVQQDVVLFSGSVADNIRYGRRDASLEDIKAAAQSAGAYEFIQRLPEQFNTLLGERGVSLSGGQRQRVAIARALLRNAPLLLLDEATSALDSESERDVQAALERLMLNRTTIVIAHRLSTVQRANRIVVMEAGRIVAQGSHAELIRQGGLYARLAALQFQPVPLDQGGEFAGARASGSH